VRRVHLAERAHRLPVTVILPLHNHDARLHLRHARAHLRDARLHLRDAKARLHDMRLHLRNAKARLHDVRLHLRDMKVRRRPRRALPSRIASLPAFLEPRETAASSSLKT